MTARERLRLYWTALRPRESLMMLGVPGLGLLFARPQLEWALALPALVFLASGALIAGHIYTLNDLLGLSYDAHDRHKRNRPLLARSLQHHSLLAFSVFLGILGYGLLAWVSFRLLLPALLLNALWFIYSLPSGLKGYPIITSLVNGLGAGILPFLLGYLFIRPFSSLALLLSLYFGLIAGAGQLVREILDEEPDRSAHLHTTAVWLGPRRTLQVSLLLFFASGPLLLAITLSSESYPWQLGAVALAAQPAQWLLYRKWVHRTVERNYLLGYIEAYRRLYALVGVCFGALLLAEMLA